MVLLPGRTAHPLGPPCHPASSPGLALGKPVQQRPGSTARPAAPFLTAAPATGPPPSPSSASQSKVSPTRAAHLGQREFLAAYGHFMRGSLRRPQAHYRRHPPGRSHLHSCNDPLQCPQHSVWWIRAKASIMFPNEATGRISLGGRRMSCTQARRWLLPNTSGIVSSTTAWRRVRTVMAQSSANRRSRE